MPSLNDVLAGSQAQAVQVQQIIDALKGTPNKGVPVALTAINDSANYALTVQNNDPVNSRALSVLKADGTTLISADATGVTLGSPVNTAPGSIPGTGLANGSVPNAALGPDVARANMLANGGFEIWQRGNGPYTTTAYCADRWLIGGVVTSTFAVTKETGVVDTGSLASAKVVYTRVSDNMYLQQQVNTADGAQIRGRTVSLSVRVYSSVNGTVSVGLSANGTGAPSSTSVTNSATNTWQTLTTTLLVPPDATILAANLNVTTTSCTAYFDNASLVVGSQPANYVPLHPADELARCLRYYALYNTVGSNLILGVGHASSTTNAYVPWRFNTLMAVTPTFTVSSPGHFQLLAPGAVTATSVAGSLGPYGGHLAVGVAAGLVAGNAVSLQAANPSGNMVAEANP